MMRGIAVATIDVSRAESAMLSRIPAVTKTRRRRSSGMRGPSMPTPLNDDGPISDLRHAGRRAPRHRFAMRPARDRVPNSMDMRKIGLVLAAVLTIAGVGYASDVLIPGPPVAIALEPDFVNVAPGGST